MGKILYKAKKENSLQKREIRKVEAKIKDKKKSKSEQFHF